MILCLCGAVATHYVVLDEQPEAANVETPICNPCLDVLIDAAAPWSLTYGWPLRQECP